MDQQYEDYQQGKLYQLSYYLYGVVLISLNFLLTNILFITSSFFTIVFLKAGLMIFPLLFLILVLSLIPIGPSWAAALYTAKTLKNKEFYSITKNFYKGYKLFFKKSLYSWLVVLAAIGVILLNIWAVLSSQVLGFLIFTLFALAAITLSVGIYLFPLLIHYSLGVIQLLKLALYFTFKKSFSSVLLIMILLLSIYLLLSFPIIFFLVIPGSYVLTQYLFCNNIFEMFLVDKE